MTGDQTVEDIYERLFAWCDARGFAGADPFDGLNSRLYQLSPLKFFRPARLALLQAAKRSPVDLRPLLLVPNGVNPKTLALFALAELSRYRATSKSVHSERACPLIDRLLEASVDSPDGMLAFGYNFDWQSRVFYAPRGTPAVVPTAFACRALTEAYDAFGSERYLDRGAATCAFIARGLNRSTESEDEVCFSYTPIDRTRVLNASLLAGECLARVGKLTENDEFLFLAERSARFVIRRQREDGAFAYGEEGSQAWVDNFHTAYILLSLRRIAADVPAIRSEVGVAFDRGLRYWKNNLFLDDGTPKYYDRKTYPVDIHSAAAAVAALSELGETSLAEKVLRWTIHEMLDDEGYFYYQIRRSGVVKTPFMRWGQAWMAYAIAKFLETK
jgi:hypothetical protein